MSSIIIVGALMDWTGSGRIGRMLIAMKMKMKMKVKM